MLDKRRLLILVVALIGSIALAIALQAWLVSGPGELAASPIITAEQVLAYRQGGDVWVADLASDERWRLTDNGDAYDPALSPDGRWLAYVLPDPTADKLIAQLWLADLREGHRRLVAEGELPWAAPVWSPDGERIAWAAGEWVVAVPRSGRPQTLLREAQIGIAGRPQLAWTYDGKAALAVLLVDGERGLYALPLKGKTRMLLPLDTAGPAVLAAAHNAETIALWHEGVLRLLPDASGEATPTDLATDMLTPDVTELAWWPDGQGLLIATAFSGLWSGRMSTWEWSPLAADAQDLAAAPVGKLAVWGNLVSLRQMVGPGDESLALVAPETGALRWLATPSLSAAAAIPTCAECAGHEAAIRTYDWYRYQGAADSGPMAHNNCGPTSVAMAIQFANEQVVPISEVRDEIGGRAWTYVGDLQEALDHWDVQNRRLTTMDDVDAAIRDRGSVVLAHLWMNWVTPGSDFQSPLSDPAQDSGRFYAYDSSHWVVLKGYSADGQSFIVHDPNVWDDNGVYWHSDTTPKGRNRLYPYAQVAGSLAAYDYEAIEVFYDQQGPPPKPLATPVPTIEPQPKTKEGVWHRVQKGDMLYALAQRYGVSISNIVNANKIRAAKLIYIGQRLWIPQSAGQTPSNAPLVVAPTPLTAPAATPTSAAPLPTIAATAAAPALTATATAVPSSPTPTTPSLDEGQWHTISYGDTLAQLATRYGVSLDTLLAANPDVKPMSLRLGQRIWVPVPAAATPEPLQPTEAPPTVAAPPEEEEPVMPTPTTLAGRWYIVQPGDSLWNLELRFGPTIAEIAAANNMNPNTPLRIGQRLLIPE